MRGFIKAGATGAAMSLLLLTGITTVSAAQLPKEGDLSAEISKTFAGGQAEGLYDLGRVNAYKLAQLKGEFRKVKAHLLSEEDDDASGGENNASADGNNASGGENDTPPANGEAPAEKPKPVCEEGKDCGAKGTATPDFSKNVEDDLWFGFPEIGERFKTGNTVTIPQPTSGGQGAGVIPKGLEKYYNQKLDWQPCVGTGYEKYKLLCAYLIVPMDYSKPDGPTIALAMSKIPALDPQKKKGSVFGNPGGPGGSGLWTAISHSRQLANFDAIGFDPRGVGSSLPQIRCQSSDAKDKERSNQDLYTTEWLDKQLEYNTKQCYVNTAKGYNGITGEEFIPNVGTANVIRDLDVMRAVVGDPKLTYVGYSYGTSIGYHYANMFPENTRALVLDGQVNPFENNDALLYGELNKFFPATSKESAGVSQMRGFGETFEQFLKACISKQIKDTDEEGNPVILDCPLGAVEGGNPTKEQIKDAYKAYQDLVQKGFGTGYYKNFDQPDRPVSFADLNMGAIKAMYSDSLWPALVQGLQKLKDNRDASGIVELADDYFGRDENGKYEFSDDAFRTISCTDTWESSEDPQREAEDKIATIKVAPFNDPGKDPVTGKQRGVEPQFGWCHYYKTRKQLPQSKLYAGENLPNTLVVSSSYDPATPYQNGVLSAIALKSNLLSVANNSHCAYRKVRCATQLVNAYLSDPTTFQAAVRSGVINKNDKITGKKAIDPTNKDIYSKVIEGKQCRVQSFNPAVVKLTDEAGKDLEVNENGAYKVNRGDKVKVVLDGFVQDDPIAITLDGDKIGPEDLKGDLFNRAETELVVPTGKSDGTYKLNFASQLGAANVLIKIGKGETVGTQTHVDSETQTDTNPEVNGYSGALSDYDAMRGLLEKQYADALAAANNKVKPAPGAAGAAANADANAEAAAKAAEKLAKANQAKKGVDSELSNTGAMAGSALAVAALLVVAGGVLVMARKRKVSVK